MYKTDKLIRIFAILSAKPEILRVKLIFSILYEFVFVSGLNIYTLRVIKPHFKYVTFTAWNYICAFWISNKLPWIKKISPSKYIHVDCTCSALGHIIVSISGLILFFIKMYYCFYKIISLIIHHTSLLSFFSVMYCSDPGHVEHATRTLSDPKLLVGTTIQYSCNTGFILQGGATITCYGREPGTPVWTSHLPHCVCGYLKECFQT